MAFTPSKGPHKGLQPISLKGRALRLLSGREYSRHELERKLIAFEEVPGTLAQALDELEAKGFINEQRVLDSVLYRRAAKLGTAIFANVFGYSIEDYAEVIRVLEDADGLAGYELNVSCPNTKHGGIYFSNDPLLLSELVAAAHNVIRSSRPLIVKLSPNVSRIQPLAQAAAEAGADALSVMNTLIGLAIDAHARKSRLGNGFGGLSGPAIKPVALRMVWETFQAVKIPILGLGGIVSGEDAAEFMIAGASAVQIGTANFWEPSAPVRIAKELDRFLRQENISTAASLVGTLKF